jgi:hypothetical protein
MLIGARGTGRFVEDQPDRNYDQEEEAKDDASELLTHFYTYPDGDPDKRLRSEREN